MRTVRCPGCGHAFRGHECVTKEGARPKTGDLSMCDGCGIVFAFTKDGVRPATDAESGEVLAVVAARRCDRCYKYKVEVSEGRPVCRSCEEASRAGVT